MSSFLSSPQLTKTEKEEEEEKHPKSVMFRAHQENFKIPHWAKTKLRHVASSSEKSLETCTTKERERTLHVSLCSCNECFGRVFSASSLCCSVNSRLSNDTNAFFSSVLRIISVLAAKGLNFENWLRSEGRHLSINNRRVNSEVESNDFSKSVETVRWVELFNHGN